MVVDDRVSTSMELYDRAGMLIPGRTQFVSRRASMFAEGVSPVYADRAKGSRFIDVDGNEYIDWNNCVSAVILGHADPVVDGAVKEQIDRGSLYSVNSPAEIVRFRNCKPYRPVVLELEHVEQAKAWRSSPLYTER